MNLFGVSLGLLCAAVAVESLLLLSILKDVRYLSGIFEYVESKDDFDGPYFGQRVPSFSVASLSGSGLLTDAELVGSESMFLFLGKDELTNWTESRLSALVNIHWSQLDGKVFLVCCTPIEIARRFASSSIVRRYGSDLDVLVDHDSTLRRTLLLSTTPSSVLIDETGLITKIGMPEPITNAVVE